MLDKKFWKKNFKVYDILNQSIPYQKFMDEIIKEADIKNQDIILDAGCGTGNFEFWLRQKKPNLKVKIIGLANSPDGLEVYKKKIKDADVILADLTERLPFKDNYFDKIVSNNVIFTIKPGQRTGVLRELQRVLKPGGKIVISNIKYDWSPFEIYISSIKEELARSGFLKMLSLLVKTFIPTVRLFYYNNRIVKEAYFGNCRCMDEYEQERKLKKAGFKNISEDKHVYADQAIMNSAEK